MTSHGKVICSECGKTIQQCRCPDHNHVTLSKCKACEDAEDCARVAEIKAGNPVLLDFDPTAEFDTPLPTKWDRRFLELAKLVSTWSKDPSTQCGTAIIRPDKTIVSVGFNGFPRGMDDNPELYLDRGAKYTRIVHSEMNAILQSKEEVKGCSLFVYPFLTCDRCAVHIIQAGILRVVAPICPPDKAERWSESFNFARNFYKEAGIIVSEVEFE